MSRTNKQYTAFRKAFKKWSKKYKSLGASRARITPYGIIVYGHLGKKRPLAEYVAPDYIDYMRYMWRNYL